MSKYDERSIERIISLCILRKELEDTKRKKDYKKLIDSYTNDNDGMLKIIYKNLISEKKLFSEQNNNELEERIDGISKGLLKLSKTVEDIIKKYLDKNSVECVNLSNYMSKIQQIFMEIICLRA